jgi:hypothetical protein
MRLFLSIFLLFTMLSSVAVAVMQQAKDNSVCELKESKGDDDNTKDTDEKESKTEKDLFVYKNTLRTYIEDEVISNSKFKIRIQEEKLISSLYTFLPYNPPEV